MFMKVAVVFFILQYQMYGISCHGTCREILQDICPNIRSMDTAEQIQLGLKSMSLDHPTMKDKYNLYCGYPACYSQPCLNGGTCLEETDGFSCSCREGFGGELCESACYLQPCLNNGTCMEENGGYSCSCQAGFAGARCEYEICPGNWVHGKTKCFLVDGLGSQQWYEAQQFCKTLEAVTMGNGDVVHPSLLFIENEEDFQLLQPKLLQSNIAAEGVWVNCNEWTGRFVCIKDHAGNTSTYRNWADDEGLDDGNNCVTLDSISGRWDDVDCYIQKPFFCQVDIPTFGITFLT